MIIECGECREYVDAKEYGGYVRQFGGREPSCCYTLLCCAKCASPMVIRQTNIGNMAEGDIWDRPFLLFPSPDIQANPRAPQAIRRAFEEACGCFRAQAYTASAIMCRKALEGICVEHDVKERNLALSLKKMKDAGLIDDRLFEWSDALRLAGNEAAHGVETNIESADAKDIIEFTNAIIDYMFSFRDRFDQFKKRRDKNPKQ